jgi:hypothetical protein
MYLTERITITLPDLLFQRLQPVKNSMNISGLCQQAIEQAVTIEELKGESKNMDKLIEKLKLEKEQDNMSLKSQGITDGIEDATELSYTDFKHLEIKESISDDVLEWLRENRLEHMDDINSDNENVYLKGWLEGVLSVWEQVKGHL